jgi:hypothetical protein
MKFTIPWKKSAPEPEGKNAVIDIHVPRRRVYHEGQPSCCPRCGGPVQKSYQTYLVVTNRGSRNTDSFMMGGDDIGWFCAQCPTVVIDSEKVSQMLACQLSHWDVGSEFAVAGIVDLEAVPHDKRNVPMGEDDNPIPLIEFTNESGMAGHRRRPKAKAHRQHR